MPQTDRERFKALLDAKKNKGGDDKHDHADERRTDRTQTAKSKQNFRRKV